MTSQPGLHKIAIHILPNISRSKCNQTMKFGQLIDNNKRKTSLQKLCRKWGGETSSKPLFMFIKILIWGESKIGILVSSGMSALLNLPWYLSIPSSSIFNPSVITSLFCNYLTSIVSITSYCTCFIHCTLAFVISDDVSVPIFCFDRQFLTNLFAQAVIHSSLQRLENDFTIFSKGAFYIFVDKFVVVAIFFSYTFVWDFQRTFSCCRIN